MTDTTPSVNSHVHGIARLLVPDRCQQLGDSALFVVLYDNVPCWRPTLAAGPPGFTWTIRMPEDWDSLYCFCRSAVGLPTIRLCRRGWPSSAVISSATWGHDHRDGETYAYGSCPRRFVGYIDPDHLPLVASAPRCPG